MGRTIKPNHIIGCLTQRTDVNVGFYSAVLPRNSLPLPVSHSLHSMLHKMHMNSPLLQFSQTSQAIAQHRGFTVWSDINMAIAQSLKAYESGY